MSDTKKTCTLTCPKCKKSWGKMKFKYGSHVRGSDVTVTFGKKRRYKDGEDLVCANCGYAYTNHDIMLNICESVHG